MTRVIFAPQLLGIGFGLGYFLFGFPGLMVLLSLFLGLLAIIYFNQGKLLYMPAVMNMPKSPSQNPPKNRHPREHNLDTIDLKLSTSDGVNIAGWHVKCENSKRIIIYLHENAGNIGARIQFVKYLTTFTNSDVILVAYRGYSDSEGEPSQPGLKKDAQAIITYALDYAKTNNKKLYLFGSSLGGAVSIYAATKNEFMNEIDGLILQNTFTSIGHMIDCLMPMLSFFKFLQTNHWRSIDIIKYVKAPILFIRSLEDELVPPEHMEDLMNAATEAKDIMDFPIKGGTHNSHWDMNPDAYFEKMVEFFEHNEKGSE